MEKENKNKKKKVSKGLLKKSLIAAGSAAVAATAVVSVVACGTNEKTPEKGGVPVGTSKDGTKGVEIETKDDHDKSLTDNEENKAKDNVKSWHGSSTTAGTTLSSANLKSFSRYDAQTKTLTINEGVTQIDNDAITANLHDGGLIANLVLPDSLTQINTQAFSTFNIKALTLGSSVASIGANVFHNSHFTKIDFDMSVEQFKALLPHIDADAFNHPKIQVVQSMEIQNYIATNFDQSLKAIFNDFTTVSGSWVATGGALPNNGWLQSENKKKFSTYDASTKTLYIKEGIKIVTGATFHADFPKNPNFVEHVVLPLSITDIWDSTFTNQESITSLYIPLNGHLSGFASDSFKSAKLTKLALTANMNYFDGNTFASSRLESLTFEGLPKRIEPGSLIGVVNPDNIRVKGMSHDDVLKHFHEAFVSVPTS